MNLKNSLISPETVSRRLEANPFVKLSEIVRDILEEAIIKLYIKPGEKINVVAIADALNLSRTPVREALNILVSDGLVVTRPNINGYYVFDFNDKYMADFFEARSAIEVAATRNCAERFRSIDLSHLKDCCDIFRSCYDTHDYKAFVAADRDFHKSMVTYTDNRFLMDMYASIGYSMEYYAAIACLYLEHYGYGLHNNFERMINEHIAIYNAISMGLADNAENISRTHLTTSYTSFVSYSFRSLR